MPDNRYRRPVRRNRSFGGFELFTAAIIVIIVVTLIVMVVRGVQGESICDMYPSWTPVRDLPIGCLDEVMGR